MQDPIAQELSELLGLVSDIKTRLRQLETRHAHEPSESTVDPGSITRTRHHLALVLEALGQPTWGFAAAPASSLKITGFYSSDIYKALRDVRSAAAKGDDTAAAGTTNGDTPSGPHDGGAWLMADVPGLDTAAPSEDPAPTKAPAGQDGGADDSNPSVWVQDRVGEIHRALSAAFGEDDILSEPSVAPKPFAPPEFVGNTDALAVPDLIGFFQMQRKTGVLTIDARHEQFTLEYLSGELIHARSTSSPPGERLGEILVQLGHITDTKLQRLLAGKATAERIGDALRRGDIIDEAKIAQALEVQVQRIFHRMFNLQGCRFTFREGLEGEPRARVRYNVTRLLLETARHHDERQERAGDGRLAS